MVLLNLDIHNFLQKNNLSISKQNITEDILKFIQPKFADFKDVDFRHAVQRFVYLYKKKWKSANYTVKNFEKKFVNWLNEYLIVRKKDNEPTASRRGRKPVAFDNSSNKTKKRRVSCLIESHSSNELFFAANKKFRDESVVIAAKNVLNISNTDKATKYSADEALALIIDASLTKASYQLIRSGALEKEYNIYPAYNDVRDAKLKCYPANITVEDYSASVPLKDLMTHTLQRICAVQEPVLRHLILNDKAIKTMTLTCKAGFDGATGQSIYKQVLSEPDINRDLKREESLFITCLVPLDLTGFNNSNEKVPIWRNQKSSSTAYCRPIRFAYKMESKGSVIEEDQYIKSEIESLGMILLEVCGSSIEVNCIIELTMIDGKVQTILSKKNNSYQCCSVCGVSPKNMNSLDILNIDYTNREFKYGLSSLHAWIRFFEMLLHIAYKKETRKWQARSKEHKEKASEAKQKIQTDFMNKMGLVVDFPKSGGSGTSNDGNTSRRAFAVYEQTAEILGIDQNLIFRFYIILVTLSSGYEIDCLKFKDYCFDTFRLYVSLYPWYYMAQSVHKVLIHGHDIIKSLTLPIGLMSEEAQEAGNKDFKSYRENFSRKTSRKATNTDLINRLLVSSDPVISSLRKSTSHQTNHKAFPSDVLQLLKQSSNDIIVL